MSSAGTLTQSRSEQEWFASWFDSPHYHRLYAHRNEVEAAAFVDRLIGRLSPAPGAAMADLGCGTGRHARQLSARGFCVTGIDLSSESLARARRQPAGTVRYIRQDMREPFGTGVFDYVFSLFTSFGYFEHQADHLLVVRNIARSLRPGGTVVLDYLNVHKARVDLVPDEQLERDGVRYTITRWIEHAAFFKRIVIEEPGLPGLSHVERVAWLDIEDFYSLFAACGLRINAIHGDYQLGAFNPASSPRLIVIASAARPGDSESTA